MNKFSSIVLILFCGVFLATPVQAQRKFFEPGEGGLTVAATYKSYSAFVDLSSSSGFGVIADYSFSGRIGLGLETVWRKQGDDYPELSYESHNPDITPFFSLQLMRPTSNFGIELVFSHTIARDLRKSYPRPYDFDFEVDIKGSCSQVVGDFYYQYNFSPSFQAIPQLSAGLQRLNNETMSNEGFHGEGAYTGINCGAEISFFLNKKFFLTASYSVYTRKNFWQNCFQSNAGIVLF